MTLKKFDAQAYIDKEQELNEIITIQDGHIVIAIPGNDFGQTYDIPLSNLKTGEQVVSWIFQLTEKNWIDRDILRRFIKEASHHAGINL